MNELLVCTHMEKETLVYKVVITSLPMMVIEGAVKSHGTSPNIAHSKGLVHNNTNVAATISFEQMKKIYIIIHAYKFNIERVLELDSMYVKWIRYTLSATGSKNAPNAVSSRI